MVLHQDGSSLPGSDAYLAGCGAAAAVVGLPHAVGPLAGSAATQGRGPAEGGCRVTQTAGFDPLGLSELLCWYRLYPIHWLIFRWMLRGVAARNGTG